MCETSSYFLTIYSVFCNNYYDSIWLEFS